MVACEASQRSRHWRGFFRRVSFFFFFFLIQLFHCWEWSNRNSYAQQRQRKSVCVHRHYGERRSQCRRYSRWSHYCFPWFHQHLSFISLWRPLRGIPQRNIKMEFNMSILIEHPNPTDGYKI